MHHTIDEPPTKAPPPEPIFRADFTENLTGEEFYFVVFMRIFSHQAPVIKAQNRHSRHILPPRTRFRHGIRPQNHGQ